MGRGGRGSTRDLSAGTLVTVWRQRGTSRATVGLVSVGSMRPGRMAERTKATVLKTVSGATRSWVRIPLLPPEPTVDDSLCAVRKAHPPRLQVFASPEVHDERATPSLGLPSPEVGLRSSRSTSTSVQRSATARVPSARSIRSPQPR